MGAQLIDGKAIAATLRQQVKNSIEQRTAAGKRPPGLAVILVGLDNASHLYVRNKRKACLETGIYSQAYDLPAETTQVELLALIEQLNHDRRIDGILVQLPLPAHINAETVIEAIQPDKDVDGFHPYNIGRLAVRLPTLRSCTPHGIITLLDSIGEPYKGRHAVVVGVSNHVGRPLCLELLLKGATVTATHRFTHDLATHVQAADIVIAAAGKPNLVKGDWIKIGATVIDVGINHLDDGRVVGDVEFAVASQQAAWITPVPGGVGPMTVATLLQNTLYAAEQHGD